MGEAGVLGSSGSCTRFTATSIIPSRQPQHTEMNLPPALSCFLPGDFEYTPPVIALLTANIITIILAIIQNWDLATVLFSYWAQSIIIGVFAVLSILTCDRKALLEDMNTPDTDGTKKAVWTERNTLFYVCIMAGFFCLHYGLFHWAYFAFIVESGFFGPPDFTNWGLWASCGLFFCNHLFSWFYYRKSERQGSEYITGEFFRPYNRIIPMHLTIIFGSIMILVLMFLGITTVLPVLVLFLILKTDMDLKMHLRKHYESQHPDEPKAFIVF
jgi:hypothetical protein